MGEHLPCKQGVTSSNLVISTRRSEDVKAESPQMRSIWERLQEMRGKLACRSDSLQERRRRSLQGDRKQSISEPHVTEQAKLAKSLTAPTPYLENYIWPGVGNNFKKIEISSANEEDI